MVSLFRNISQIQPISENPDSSPVEQSKQATLELLAKLYFATGVVYAVWLLFRGFGDVALLTFCYSILFIILVPASRKGHFPGWLKTLLFFLAGLPFATINVFFCGPGYGIQIALWIVFAVNISFVVLPIRQAFVFGSLVTAMLIVKQYMMYSGYEVNLYLLPKQLIERPDFVDILVPAFFNLAATFTFYMLYQNSLNAALTAAKQIKQANLKLTETMVSLDSARKKAEESDRLKTLFLANISHDLKTPLNAIMGFSEILMRPILDDKKRIQYANQILIGSRRLFAMIVDILYYSKMETGSTTLIETPGKVNQLIDRAIAMAYEDDNYKGKQLSLVNKSDVDIQEETITADFLKLNQVLSNLLHNAIKFTARGEIAVRAIKIDAGIEFSVSDTGIGIPADKLEEIFEPFTHSNDLIHDQYGGKGLGLTVCRGLVTQWGGKIWAESTLNQGTTIRFTLPVKTS